MTMSSLMSVPTRDSIPPISVQNPNSFRRSHGINARFNSVSFPRLGAHGNRNPRIVAVMHKNCSSSVSFQPLRFHNLRSQSGFLGNTKIRSLTNENCEDQETELGSKKISSFIERVKQISILSILNDIKMFLQKNIKVLTVSASVSIALGLCYLFLRLTAIPCLKVVPYSELVSNLQAGAVTTLLFEEGSQRIYYNTDSWGVKKNVAKNVVDKVESKDVLGNLKKTYLTVWNKLAIDRSSNPQWECSTRMVDIDEYYLLSLLREKGVTYISGPQSALMSVRNMLNTGFTATKTFLVYNALPVWIPMLPLIWLQYNQVSAFNNRPKKPKHNAEKTSFTDVEGVDPAKAELMEIVSCLRGAINYSKLGAKLPRGVLLVGPPGTGKTLLARAVAGEAGVPIFTASASEFVEVFAGRGAARVRDLFNEARKKSPSIVFIDEIDAVGGKRGRNVFNDERDQTLNQLLTEMDGFDSDMKVIVIAATNIPEALDSALLRPGRFSRKVHVGEPDEDGRRKILAVHLRGVPLEEDTDVICSLIASLTPGFVGADLANIANEAALLAARRGHERVSRKDIMEAIEREKFGINDKKGKTSRTERTEYDTRQDGIGTVMHGPLGYQTLS